MEIIIRYNKPFYIRIPINQAGIMECKQGFERDSFGVLRSSMVVMKYDSCKLQPSESR